MANANQTSANNPKDLYLSTDGGSIMKYAGDVSFTTTNNGAAPFQSTSRLVTQNGAFFIQNGDAINFTEVGSASPGVQINPDATQQNQVTGLFVSTSASIGGLLQTEGNYSQTMNILQRDNLNNLVNQWAMLTPKTSAGGVQPSTLQMFNYAAIDNFAFNSITSPVWTINPTIPRIDIPTYTVNAASLQVSSINGGLPPAASTVIDITQIIPANAAYPQAVTSAASISDARIVPGAIYQYDLSVHLLSAVANNAGSAPTYPYNIAFGVRLGGNGDFNYTQTVALQSAGGLGAGGTYFNLTGTATAGNSATTIEIVIFQGQTGTTVSLAFAAPVDPTMTLQRIQ